MTSHGWDLFVEPTLDRLFAHVAGPKYHDKQFKPSILETEGDVADATVYNLLVPIVEALNDVLDLAGCDWRVHLQSQVSDYDGWARTDHLIVALKVGHEYQPRYSNWDTPVATIQREETKFQYVLTIVEEKTPGYLAVAPFSQPFQGSLKLTFAPPNVQAPFTQLLKYSESFHCTRFLLTDYGHFYLLELEKPAIESEIRAAREQERQKNPRPATPSPDLWAFHWSPSATEVRKALFTMCFVGLYELGVFVGNGLRDRRYVNRWRWFETELQELEQRQAEARAREAEAQAGRGGPPGPSSRGAARGGNPSRGQTPQGTRGRFFRGD